MQTHRGSTKRSKAKSKWQKVRGITGLRRYLPSGMYFAWVKVRSELHRESLKVTDLDLAKRKLRAKIEQWDRTAARVGKISLVHWLEKHYCPTLRGAETTVADKKRIIQRIKKESVFFRTQPMTDIRESQVSAFLAEHYGQQSASSFNSALWLLRDAFALAVSDGVIIENPCSRLKACKRKQPIRLMPTFEQFQAIIADVRSSKYNRHHNGSRITVQNGAEDSADFLEACGLLGLGQAELAGIKKEHVDLESGRMAIYRHKTSCQFTIPIYPQARALIERLCEGKKAGEHLLPIQGARKALTNACKRLGYPHFTQRSLRRLHITRCLELGIDVKTVASWQGHKDSGVLILQNYSHVRAEHSQRMAALLSTDQPRNVIELQADQPRVSRLRR